MLRNFLLSDHQLRLLCYLAYSGRSLDGRLRQAFCRAQHTSEFELLEAQRLLSQRGLTTDGARGGQFIAPHLRLSVLLLLVHEHADWLASFRLLDMYGRPDSEAMQAVQLADAVMAGRPSLLRQKYSDSCDNLLWLCCPVFGEPQLMAEIGQMPLSMFGALMERLIPWLLEHDVEATESLLNCWRLHPDYSARLDKAWQQTLLYCLYAKGTLPSGIDTDALPLVQSFAQGIQALKGEAPQTALPHFADALQYVTSGVSFPDFISNYLYAMALATDGSASSRLLMANLSRDVLLRQQPLTIPLFLLANYHKSTIHLVDDMALRQLIAHAQQHQLMGYGCVCFVLCSMMKRYRDIDLNALDYVPHLWILRHQAAPYLNNVPSEPAQPEEHTSVAPVQPDDDSRLVYVLEETLNLQPYVRRGNAIEQDYTFARITNLDYCRGNIPRQGIESVDRQIWSLWSRNGQRMPLQLVMPLLQQSDRLYAQYGLLFVQTRPAMDPLYIQVSEEPEGIRIESNVSASSIQPQCRVIYRTERGKILYTNLPADGLSQIRQVLSQSLYPMNEEENLRQLFLYLALLIEVRGNCYAAGGQLATYQGQANVIVQVSERKNSRNIRTLSLLTQPLADQPMRTPAASGNDVLFTRMAGRTVMVQRDMQAEQQLVTQLIQHLKAIGCQLTPLGQEPQQFTITIAHLLELVKYVSLRSDSYQLEWQCEPINLHPLTKQNLRAKIHSKEKWLELEGEVYLDEGQVMSVRDFFNTVLTQESDIIQIGENDYGWLQQDLRQQIEQLSAGFHDTGHSLKASEQAATLLADDLDSLADAALLQWLEENRQRMVESQFLTITVPRTLQAQLRPYQLDGYEWMSRLAHWGAGACLADDMGLGKTLQSITFMLSHAGEGASLVVAPASVVKNWESEFHRFAPSLRVLLLNASSHREELLDQANAGAVVVVTYGVVVSMQVELKQRSWCVICLDEAHTIKNKATRASSAIMQMQCSYRLALTGTPIQNNLSELWNIFQFTNPGLLGGYKQFVAKFVNPIMNAQNLERQEQLKRIIAPFMKRRTKAEVVRELPQKLDQMVLVNLGGGELEAYEHLRRQAETATRANRKNGQKGKMDILAEITKLRLAACCIALQTPQWQGPCSKLAAFQAQLLQIRQADSDARVLVFSQFTSFLSMAGTRLTSMGFDYLYLDGSTPIRQRAQLVQKFQEGQCPLFLISLQAGGLGLNLTAANHVILMDPWWNPAIEQQAIDRAYRIGQQRDVTVHHLIAANTIEEKIVRLQQTKRDMATALLSGEELSGTITLDELQQLLRK